MLSVDAGRSDIRNLMTITTQQGIRSIPNPATRHFQNTDDSSALSETEGDVYTSIMDPYIKPINSCCNAHACYWTQLNLPTFIQPKSLERINLWAHQLCQEGGYPTRDSIVRQQCDNRQGVERMKQNNL